MNLAYAAAKCDRRAVFAYSPSTLSIAFMTLHSLTMPFTRALTTLHSRLIPILFLSHHAFLTVKDNLGKCTIKLHDNVNLWITNEKIVSGFFL